MISKQIGWSSEENLLYEILKATDRLTKVISTSGGGGGGWLTSGTTTLTAPVTVQHNADPESPAIIFDTTGGLSSSNEITLFSGDRTKTDGFAVVSVYGNSGEPLAVDAYVTGTGTSFGGLYITENSSTIYAEEGEFTTGVLGIKIRDFRAGASQVGVEYDDDYSANYTNRSLVDKEYVDTRPKEYIVACSDLSTALTTGTNKGYFRIPRNFTLTEVRASLLTAQSAGSILTIDINKNGSTILSTLLTIDNGEKTSVTADAPAVISDNSFVDDDEITIDITQVGTSPVGLIVALIGY